MKARKEAYLRKHGLGSPRPSKEEIVTASDSESSPKPAKSQADGEKSWAQKRKEHMLARASGVPVRTASDDVDVAMAAVKFAAKLKVGAQGPSWKQKRKDAYLATHNAKRPEKQVRVAVKSVVFAQRLLKLRNAAGAAAAAGQEVDPLEAGIGGTDSLPSPRRKPPGEKTWTQKRKETYLKRYARQPSNDPPEADVAVSAVHFAAALKARRSAAADAVGGGSASISAGETSAVSYGTNVTPAGTPRSAADVVYVAHGSPAAATPLTPPPALVSAAGDPNPNGGAVEVS